MIAAEPTPAEPPATRFARLDSMTVYPLPAGQVLAVPGRHEAAALSDACPSCIEPAEPASVLDVTRGRRVTGRVAAYRCTRCTAAWLCWWAPPPVQVVALA